MNKEAKILFVAKTFLEHPTATMEELSNLTGISKSSVQRYLNDPVLATLTNTETFDKIQKQLAINLITGRKKGGLNSFANNDGLKDELGRFTGNIKTTLPDKITKKINQITEIAYLFLTYHDLSLEQLAAMYNRLHPEETPITKSYVYDCLTSKEQYSAFINTLFDQIEQEMNRRQSAENISRGGGGTLK